MKASCGWRSPAFEHVIIAHFDDEPSQFRELIESIPATLGERCSASSPTAVGDFPLSW
jgi:hypothetical protein